MSSGNNNPARLLEAVGLTNNNSARTLQKYIRRAQAQALAAQRRGNSCPICLDGAGYLKTPCGHRFHRRCLGRYLNHHNQVERKCPMCRAHIPGPRPPQAERRVAHPSELHMFTRWLQTSGVAEVGDAEYFLNSDSIDLEGYEFENGEDAWAIAFFIEHNPNLTLLIISGGQLTGRSVFGTPGVSLIAAAVAHNSTLQELKIARHLLGNDGAAHLADMLRVNDTLQKLDLSSNQISNEGVGRLAITLASNPNTALTHLILTDNKISDQGAGSLGAMLTNNTTLRNLTLQHNQIGDRGAISLAQSLRTNRTLRHINLLNNRYNVRGMIEFRSVQRSRDAPLNMLVNRPRT